jgi:carbonic anhydrase/acetyltransferase-like protein (isoleucine patch superfamily)
MSISTEYSQINEKEIKVLLSLGCTCDDWSIIETKAGFDPGTCRNVRFSGSVKLGLFRKSFTGDSGVVFNSGIRNALIHNCTIGDDVLIQNVGDYIANYTIGDNVIIRNCGRICIEGISSFGNGTLVSVLSETGARAVRIWDKLSAHQAYIVAMYRHRPQAVEILEQLSLEYSERVSSGTGLIGDNVTILNCTEIRNLKIGPFTRIDGAMKLNDGSVNSCREDPVFIGQGVIMEHFIICSGSSVNDSTLVDKCFIGQGCVLSKHYSVENSLFFANCGGFHGEACSIFAGPFTVTHHKSTLLIAAIFSFMNAGSGSNQSNHMYKLGPIHQGIVERGSKTTSNSYLLWPAHIGPFTLIMGRHTKNIDSSSLPFSYLIENKEESLIVPGINLRSVGTVRDAEKWPQRDVRKDPCKTDQINFNILSPYTVSKMIRGREILKKLKEETEPVSGYYLFNNMKLDNHSLERGIMLYQTGIDKFLGNCLITKLEGTGFNTNDELRSRLTADSSHGKGEWFDLAGLFAPGNEIDSLLDNIEKGKLISIEALSGYFEEIHKSYYDWAWTWAADIIEKEEGKPLTMFDASDVAGIIEKWKKSVIFLDNLLLEDAGKEFNLSSMTGFGVDGGDKDKKIDFEQVRGDYRSNRIVIKIHDHIKTKTALGDELIERMKRISASG